MSEKKPRQGKRMKERFTITVPLVITFNADIKYKEVQQLYKELLEYFASEDRGHANYDISLGKGRLEKHTVY